jgi:hypothetical protein
MLESRRAGRVAGSAAQLGPGEGTLCTRLLRIDRRVRGGLLLGGIMHRLLLAMASMTVLALAGDAVAQECVGCHKMVTPGVVADWQLSKHAENEFGCEVCHGEEHDAASNVDKVSLPTAELCGQCHDVQFEQFSKGKHALAWASLNAMPTTHALPMALVEGMKGCGGCHKIGLKSEEDQKRLEAEADGFGIASCDACHTRHVFSKKEAQQPQACRTCHMGFDHPQWEMYVSSKHGVRHDLKQMGILPESAAAPTCQDCHMQKGDHEVRTPWGFLAVRLPLPEDDEQWRADQTTILQALGVLDPEGNPTPRLEVVEQADVARLDPESFAHEREKILMACRKCHSDHFARTQIARGDEMIREADHLLAAAIRVVAGLYSDGVLEKPEAYAHPFPDLLAFQDAPTVVEQRLFEMHLEHRMRAFQGIFHSNPDYAFWYGWSEMVRDLAEIRERAEQLRAQHVAK